MAMEFTPTPLSEIKSRLNEVRYDPTLLTKVQLEMVEAVTNGTGLLVDATNPAVMLLEMAACMEANSIQESISSLRALYPSLAETDDDIYRHMSDVDYLDRFATPSEAKITISILYSALINKMVYDSSEQTWKAIIPRDTTFTVDGVVFSLLHSVVIRKYETGALQITYDTSIPNPLQHITNVVIPGFSRKTETQEEWLFFDIDVVQVAWSSNEFVLEKIYNYRKNIVFTDHYCHARVFFKNDNTGNKWVEMRTTHTDQVFDNRYPTALLRVFPGSLEVKIPVIYFTNGAISGLLRVDLYTTKGNISLNLQKYLPDAYVVEMMPIDEERDRNSFVNVFEDVSYFVISRMVTTGGKDGIAFDKLRERVIFNATGEVVLPITNTQIVAEGENSGFELVKNVDLLTNRIFLATRKLPKPSNSRLITAANIGIVSFSSILSDISSNGYVTRNDLRLTIRSNAIFKNENGNLKLMEKSFVDGLSSMGLTSMTHHINNSEYFYTPFYYVMDESGPEFDLRAYSLDQPVAKDLSFIRQNESLQLFVNTKQYSFYKTHDGYELIVQTNSGNNYKDVQDSLVGIQLAFYPAGETTLAYINGTMTGKTSDNERIFSFSIKTNHDFDKSNRIAITNAEVEGITNYKSWIDLTTEFHLLHWTESQTQNFTPDKTDKLLGRFLLEPSAAGNSHETIQLTLGYSLDNLWRRAHSHKQDIVYKRYTEDIPAVYEEDVYEKDAVTGATFTIKPNGELEYNYLHRRGDPVKNEQNQPVYLHRKGDVMLGPDGQPLFDIDQNTGREADIFVVDARYHFATDSVTVEYRKEIEATIASWVVNDIGKLEKNVLEKTEIFFYPKTTLGTIRVNVENNEQAFLTAEQMFYVDLYVNYAVYNDLKIRESLENQTVTLLDKYISENTVNMTVIREELRKLYGSTVMGFSIRGLGGDANYEVVTMADNRSKLCLRKELVILPNMTTFVEDAVKFEFKKIG